MFKNVKSGEMMIFDDSALPYRLDTKRRIRQGVIYRHKSCSALSRDSRRRIVVVVVNGRGRGSFPNIT